MWHIVKLKKHFMITKNCATKLHKNCYTLYITGLISNRSYIERPLSDSQHYSAQVCYANSYMYI